MHVILGDRIDPAKGVPIYMQVISAIVRDIERGRLSPGTYLPGTRQLANELGVNRKTVVLAYEELIAQGWLSSEGTKGTMVASTVPDPMHRTLARSTRARPASEPQYRVLPTPDPPLAVPTSGSLKLNEGAPDGRLFPPDVLTSAYRTAIQRVSSANRMLYRDPLGSRELRQTIAGMLRSQRGLTIGGEEICVTRGSQNGLFLTAQILLKPGDVVIVEALTHEPAIAAFRALGAKLVAVPLDRNGIDVEAVERTCRARRVRAIFLTPHHQFPTTVTLPPPRRLRLLDLARQFGFAIIEDDYDHEFHFASQPLLPMAAYAPEHVIYLGSLSKLLLPALRVGYVVAPREVMPALAHAISLTDGMGNRLTEEATAEIIASGELRRHARKVHKIYAERRMRFAEELRNNFGDDIDFTIPDGGLAFWLRFPGFDLDVVEARAKEAGLQFATSRSYMADEKAERGLRIGFASLNEKEAAHAISVLRQAAYAS
jgi:GntR family transcriptional regulator/MocR family aminotransferase